MNCSRTKFLQLSGALGEPAPEVAQILQKLKTEEPKWQAEFLSWGLTENERSILTLVLFNVYGLRAVLNYLQELIKAAPFSQSSMFAVVAVESRVVAVEALLREFLDESDAAVGGLSSHLAVLLSASQDALREVAGLLAELSCAEPKFSKQAAKDSLKLTLDLVGENTGGAAARDIICRELGMGS